MKFDFSKNQTVDDINKVPEDFRGLYAENDTGAYELRSDDAGVQSAVSAITRMSGALTAARGDARRAREEGAIDLSPLSDYGESPESIAEAISQRMQDLQAQIDAGGGKKAREEAQRQLDNLKKELQETHSRELEARDTVNKSLRSTLDKTIMSDRAQQSIIDEGGDPELLMPFVVGSLKTMEIDGQYVVRVVDEAGEVRFSGITGEPMTIRERVKEIKSNDKFAKLFASTSPNGSQTRQSRISPQMPPKGEMSPTQKIAAGLSKGLAPRAGNAERARSGTM